MVTRTCPICNGTFFEAFANRSHAQCSNCGSLERDRAVYMALSQLGLPHVDDSILHLAPEKCFVDLFTQSHGEKYEPVNLLFKNHRNTEGSVKTIDLCKDLCSLPSNYWNLILHNHILADVFCPVNDVLCGFDRILKPGGTMIFTIPVHSNRKTIEDTNPNLSTMERLNRFGQRDRARLFGCDVIGLIKESLNTDCFVPVKSLFTQEQFEAANIPWQPEIEPYSNSIFLYKKLDTNPPICSDQSTQQSSISFSSAGKRVLLIGFSVVEQKDGVSKEIKALEQYYSNDQNHISFDFCGLGGHHIQTVAYLISDIIAPNQYDIILLDLTSSQIRVDLNISDFKLYLESILSYIKALKLSAGLLHFYRKDINYSDDPLVETCSHIAGKFNVPSLNLGQLIHASYSSGEIDTLFRDLVHTTPNGSRVYAEQILQFVKNSFLDKTNASGKSEKHETQYVQKFSSKPIKDSLLNKEIEFSLIERHQTKFDYACINENTTLTIQLELGYQLDGIMAIIGPRSGGIEIQSESGNKDTVIVYDQYAYYERLQSFILKNKLCGCITFRQLPGIPPTKLLKGEKNTDKRIGKISHLLLSRK